jgi:hypothetical protein
MQRGKQYQVEKKHCLRGFGSLVETAAILSLSAVAAVTMLNLNKPSIENEAAKLKLTNERMKQISKSIEVFRLQQGRLPCPADPYQKNDSTRASGAATANYDNKFGRENLEQKQENKTTKISCPLNEGVVPIYALGLDANFLLDGWNNRFTYHISSNICGSSGCSSSIYNQQEGGIKIKDRQGNSKEEKAAFIIVSHGKNGLGAFDKYGKKILVTSAASAAERENSDGDDGFIKSEFNSKTFDDLLQYQTKASIDVGLDSGTRPLVHPSICERVSKRISSFNATNIAVLQNNIPGLSQATSSSGDVGASAVVLEMLWNVQQTCSSYYPAGDKRPREWLGPRCPGGATYDNNLQSCICNNTKWGGSC